MRMRLSFEPNVRPTCRPYTKLVVCELFLNVQTSKQCGKKMPVGRGSLEAVPPSHGTTGTMFNQALLECNFSVALCENAHICTLI